MFRRIDRETWKGECGISLVELLLLVLVMLVVMAIAAPSITSWLAVSQLHSASRALVGKLHEARTQAIKRNGVAWVQLDSASRSIHVQGASPSGSVDLGGREFLPDRVSIQGLTGPRQVSFDNLGLPAIPPQVVTLQTTTGMTATVTVAATGRITLQ